MRPAGRDLRPHQVLEMVESGPDNSQHEGRPITVYRRDDGEAYALGLREDVNLAEAGQSGRRHQGRSAVLILDGAWDPEQQGTFRAGRQCHGRSKGPERGVPKHVGNRLDDPPGPLVAHCVVPAEQEHARHGTPASSAAPASSDEMTMPSGKKAWSTRMCSSTVSGCRSATSGLATASRPPSPTLTSPPSQARR